MIGYKDCPNCGSADVIQSKKWTPDDGDPRADWYLTVKCNRCGFDRGREQWDNTPKHIALEQAERAEDERDEARQLIINFCIAANNNNTADLIAATFHMTQAQREWK